MNKGHVVKKTVCEIKSRSWPIRVQKGEFARDPPPYMYVCMRVSIAYKYTVCLLIYIFLDIKRTDFFNLI